MTEKKTKFELQVEYCKEKKMPLFAPEHNCWSCGKGVWAKVSRKQASEQLITGCPNCKRSFC